MYLIDLRGLTCDSHVSVGFAFIDGVHDLLRAAHKPFSTTLKKERIKESCSVKHFASVYTGYSVFLNKDWPWHKGPCSCLHVQTDWSWTLGEKNSDVIYDSKYFLRNLFEILSNSYCTKDMFVPYWAIRTIQQIPDLVQVNLKIRDLPIQKNR